MGSELPVPWGLAWSTRLHGASAHPARLDSPAPWVWFFSLTPDFEPMMPTCKYDRSLDSLLQQDGGRKEKRIA